MKQFLLFTLLSPFCLIAQSITVTGSVTDTDGKPLSWAHIYSIVDQHGTVTDLEGTFTLKVTQGTELNFTYTGYAEEQVFIKADSKGPIRVQLACGQDLPEVVVTAYATTVRSCWNRCPTNYYPAGRKFGIAPDPELTLAPLQAATIFPNPFVSHLQLDYAPVERTKLSAVLLDVAGREVRRWPARWLAPGQQTLTYRMGTARLLPGLYLLRLTDQEGRTEVRKVRKSYGG